MATPIDVHPVRFNHLLNCGIRPSSISQLVQCGDTTQFQMLLDICGAERTLILNNSFVDPTATPWTPTGSIWTYDPFLGRYSCFPGSAKTLTQLFGVADDVMVKIVIDVTVEEEEFEMVFGTYAETFTETGVYTRYVTADTVTGIIFNMPPAAFVRFNSVDVWAFNTNFSVRIVDNNENVIRTINAVDEPAYFNFHNGYFTFSYDWTTGGGDCLPEGCYRFEVSDPCDCGNGGFVAEDFFTVQNQWEGVGAAWNVVGGLAGYNGSVSPDHIEVENVVCAGEIYRVEYTLVGMAGNEFQVRLGAQLGVNRTADGTYHEAITAVGSLLTEVQLIGRNTGGASAFLVQDFSITRVTRSYELKSNWFRLYTEAPCSYVLTACNDEDGIQGGFVDTGFAPRIRLEGRFGQGGYKWRFSDYENSRGRKDNNYFRSRKVPHFVFSGMEYMHDFVQTLKGYDHFYIEDTEYFVENDDYTPEYVGSYDFAEATLQVSLKTELTEKRKCRTIDKPCSPTGEGSPLIVDGGSGDGTPLETEGLEILETG